jgi:hypothetical protein
MDASVLGMKVGGKRTVRLVVYTCTNLCKYIHIYILDIYICIYMLIHTLCEQMYWYIHTYEEESRNKFTDIYV